MEQPIRRVRHLVVVVWIAQAEEAQKVLVDQIEVPETMHVAEGGVIAHRVALVGICQAAEDVPGSGDGHKQQETGDRLHLAPASPLAGKK